MIAPHASRLASTSVELITLPGRLEHSIRFGRAAAERIETLRTRTVSFLPGAIFALLRTSRSPYGAVHARLAIMRAVAIGEPHQTHAFVRPGGELLLSVEGRSKTDAVLVVIHAIERAQIDPCEVAPDHWRHVHNRVAADMSPRPYTAARHAAWLQRTAAGL